MTKSKIIAGLDIGSSKITTVIAQVIVDPNTFENTVNIVGVATTPSKGVKKGQIVDIEEAVEATIIAVEAAERMAGYNLNSAYIGVGGAHIASQNSTGVVAVSDPNGEVSAADVGRVIEAARAISLPQSREVIHILPREYVVDGESGVKDPIGMAGVRLEVETHLVTASAAALKNLTKTVGEVGVSVDGMVFTGLASAYAAISPTEKELGCVLVDIGGGTTSVAAFIDGALAYSGVIPIGGKNVTNDLAIGLRVSLEEAEEIKLGLGKKSDDQLDLAELGAKEAKKISRRTLVEGIVKPRLNEIFTMVRLDLERAGIANKIPSGAIVTGGGASTVGVAESAKGTLNLPVRVGAPSNVGGLVDDILTPGYSTPVGLILYGVSHMNMASSGSFGRKIKLPTKGVFGKLVETVKDLLP